MNCILFNIYENRPNYTASHNDRFIKVRCSEGFGKTAPHSEMLNIAQNCTKPHQIHPNPYMSLFFIYENNDKR